MRHGTGVRRQVPSWRLGDTIVAFVATHPSEEHLLDVVERLQEFALRHPRVASACPAFSVNLRQGAIEVLFSVDEHGTLAEQWASSVAVQQGLVVALLQDDPSAA